MKTRSLSKEQSGAILVMSALVIVVVMVFAALTTDLGAAWAQRRHNQSAADAGALAAALEIGETTPLEPAMVDAAIDYATRNLGGAFTSGDPTPAEWLACSDSDRPAGYQPLRDSAGNLIDCISLHSIGIVRVRLPVQNVPTAFASVIGINEIPTNGVAEADRQPPLGGVRPFGITSGLDPGEVCLRTGASPSPDCARNEEGEFRALDLAMYGHPVTGADRICGSAKSGDRYKINTARGVDHFLLARGADPYRLSGCSSSDSIGGVPLPNAIPTIQGIGSNLLLDALIGVETFPYDAGVPSASLPLLRQGSNPKRTINHLGTPLSVDNKPLWEFIDPSYTWNGDVKIACVDPDWTALATTVVPEAATAQMTACLNTWQDEDDVTPLFDTSVLESPRLAVVPEFVEGSWADKPIDGDTNEKTILRFRAVFINALNFSCGPSGCDIEFVPGTGSTAIIIPPPSKSLDQLTGFVLPFALPASRDAVDAAIGVVQLYR
jgi:hypothetical protein